MTVNDSTSDAAPPGEPIASNAVRVVKRYANRKLYDTTDRCFTTLSAIAALIRDGVEVRVVDHATGQAVTEGVLVRALESVMRTSGAGGILSALIRAPERIIKAATDDDHQAAEIRELRNEVDELTLIVGKLLGQRVEQASKATED